MFFFAASCDGRCFSAFAFHERGIMSAFCGGDYILNAPAAYLLPFMTDNIFVFMRSHTFGVSRRTR